MASIPTQDEFLAAARKGQETMALVIKTWFETVRTTNHKLISVYAPLTDRLPKLPPVRLSFAGRLPAPEDAVARAYDLAEQLLANQRRFAEDLVRETAPLLPRWGMARSEGMGSREPRISSRKAWEDAVSVAKPVAVSEPEPIAVSEPEQIAVSEPEPIAVSERKPAAVSAKKSATAKSTGTTRGTGSARRSTSAKTTDKPGGASPAPKDAAAS